MPVKKEVTPFKAFQLPFLALQNVSKHWSLYELFALSVQSKKCRNIIRNLCSHRKFTLGIYFGGFFNNLRFREESSNKITLSIRFSPLNLEGKRILKRTKEKINLNFEDCSAPIGTVIELGAFEILGSNIKADIVRTFWKPPTEPYQVMVPHLAKLFQNLSVQVSFSGEAEEFVSEAMDLFKKLSLNIFKLSDSSSSYSFIEVKQMMKIYKDIYVNAPRLTAREQKSLCRMFMEEPNPIEKMHLRVRRPVEMRHLEKVLDAKAVMIVGSEQFRKVKRPSDGRITDIYRRSHSNYLVFETV